MPEDPIHQPHDKLFKVTFTDPVNTSAFLCPEIHPVISEKMGWNRLRLEPGTFVDSHYSHCESDLLFSAPFGDSDSDCLIYILFEHQTTPDRRLAFRLLRYMVRIWESRLQTGSAGVGLPVILPIVLAQNAEVWDLPNRFNSLLSFPEGTQEQLAQYVPDFSFELIQLAALPFDKIRGTPAGIMTLRVMKAERSASLLDDKVWDEALMIELPRETLELLIRYILGTDIDREAFDGKIAKLKENELRTTTMTLADQLKQEGRQEGRQEGLEKGLQKGLQKGRQEDILEALEIRFGSVPEGLAVAIREIYDENRLRSLHRAAIQSATLEEFTKSI